MHVYMMYEFLVYVLPPCYKKYKSLKDRAGGRHRRRSREIHTS